MAMAKCTAEAELTQAAALKARDTAAVLATAAHDYRTAKREFGERTYGLTCAWVSLQHLVEEFRGSLASTAMTTRSMDRLCPHL